MIRIILTTLILSLHSAFATSWQYGTLNECPTCRLGEPFGEQYEDLFWQDSAETPQGRKFLDTLDVIKAEEGKLPEDVGLMGMLTFLGKKGWELVVSYPYSDPWGNKGIRHIFKRPG